MDIRAEFESWYTKEFGYPFNLTIRDGQYMNSDAELMWQAYKAATEAGWGGDEPLYVILAPAQDSPDCTFVEIEDANGRSVGVPCKTETPDGLISLGPLYTRPPATVVPEGWSIEHIDDPQSDGYLVHGPGINYCVWKDKEAWLYLFLDSIANAAPESDQ